MVHVLAGGGVEANKLKSLRMDIYDLDVPFIKFLALKLPRLQKFRLRVTNYHMTRSSRVYIPFSYRLVSAETHIYSLGIVCATFPKHMCPVQRRRQLGLLEVALPVYSGTWPRVERCGSCGGYCCAFHYSWER